MTSATKRKGYVLIRNKELPSPVYASTQKLAQAQTTKDNYLDAAYTSIYKNTVRVEAAGMAAGRTPAA